MIQYTKGDSVIINNNHKEIYTFSHYINENIAVCCQEIDGRIWSSEFNILSLKLHEEQEEFFF